MISKHPSPCWQPPSKYDSYLGRILTGRIETGVARVNMPLKVLHREGMVLETGRATKLLLFPRS